MATSSDAMMDGGDFAAEVMQGLEPEPGMEPELNSVEVEAVTETVMALAVTPGGGSAGAEEANPLLRMMEEKGGPDHIQCGSCGKFNSHRRMIRSGLVFTETKDPGGEVFKKFHKVCCRCWQQEKKLATGAECELVDACKDVLEFNSKVQTERSDCYKRAKEAADKSGGSCREKKKLLKKYCQSFIEAIVAADLFGALRSAAHRYERIMQHRKGLEASLMKLDPNLMEEAKELSRMKDWSLIYSVDQVVQLKKADERFVDQVRAIDEKIAEHDMLYENEAGDSWFSSFDCLCFPDQGI